MSHAAFLSDVADATPPTRLEALLRWMALHGTVVPPTERAGLHPLVVPVGREADGCTLGLLRWPTPHDGMAMPVVRQAAHDPERRWTIELVATDVDTLLLEQLVRADAAGAAVDPRLVEAIDAHGALYAPGTLAASRLPLPAFLLTKVGAVHGFFEPLAEKHLAKGDPVAAKVTADRSCRLSEGWGRPYAYRALLLARLGEHEEARDAAVAAIGEPAWTMFHPFDDVCRIAGWTHKTSIGYRRLLANTKKPAADRAAHLMDAIAVEGGDWDSCRTELAALYAEAGLDAVSRFVS